VVEVLVELGGVASRRQLVDATSRVEVDRALAEGGLVRLARGRYALPAVEEAAAAAHRLSGVVSRLCAAQHWGWAVQTVPDQPHVTVPQNRKVRAAHRDGVAIHYVDLGPDDIDGIATSKDRTLLDCLRSEPFDSALAVADSALRTGFPRARLLAVGRGARGPGAPQVLAVSRAADGRAANPFESVLRGIAGRVPGLSVEPQVTIRDPHFLGRPDLVDQRLKIVLEADSFEWHGGREALTKDARRYNAFTVAGWLVLRFSWEDVMFHPLQVQAVLEAAVVGRVEVLCPGCRAPSGSTSTRPTTCRAGQSV
jgi:very-short-patch-repair endonuclease